jgi:DNA-binding transcriptional ArsR family regulator
VADRDFFLAPETVTVQVGLEPAHNLLNSLMLLSDTERLSGFNDWVLQTADRLSPQHKHNNRLLAMGFMDAVIPDRSWDSFPKYMDYLAAQDAVALRDRALMWLDHKENPPSREALINDADAFLSFMESVYSEKKMESFDPALYNEIHGLLNDPPAMKKLLLTHLRAMWDEMLAPEWQRVQPMLQDAVEAFAKLDYSGLNALEAVRLVTGRDMSMWWADHISRFKELIFVPSAHIGPYITSFDDNGRAWIIFGARLPKGVQKGSPALSRSELMVQLSALADDTRLQILELLTEHGELCAQDIISLLNLSQSSASRHLRQLTATGYLTERRQEVSKCYSLNMARFDDTIQAMRRFLRGK